MRRLPSYDTQSAASRPRRQANLHHLTPSLDVFDSEFDEQDYRSYEVNIHDADTSVFELEAYKHQLYEAQRQSSPTTWIRRISTPCLKKTSAPGAA